MLKNKKYFRVFVIILIFTGLTLTAAFASAGKSLIQEAIPLVMDNYIDQPDMSFLATQALEGAKLKLRQEKKDVPALNDVSANLGQDKSAVIAFIKDSLTKLSDQSGISYQELEYAALKNLAVSLDPYSNFLTRQEMKELTVSQKGVFAGVGMEVSIKDSILTVVSPLDDSPSLAAGILAGDHILQIDNTPTKNLTIMQAVNLIRGEAGSIVRILVMRKSFDKPREFAVRRALITIKSVKYRQIGRRNRLSADNFVSEQYFGKSRRSTQ